MDLTSSKAYFSAIPWCAELLSEPGWTVIPTYSRKLKDSTEDSFFAETLQTPRTIAQCLSLCKASSIPLPSSHVSTSALPIPAVRTLLTLGSGLNGFPAIAHGGLLTVLLDEGMGILLTVNNRHASARRSPDITEMTVYLNVRFRAPVETPGVVLVEATVEKREGRKTWFKARVVDAEGKECVTGEGMFVDVPNSRM
jgi:acyl-coenzyme A thioesterase THEM4